MKLFFDIIIYSFSFLGGVISIVTIYKWIIPYKRVGWKKVEKGVIRLRDKLIRDQYYPTLIVGIGRGGSIIGALLSGCLGNVPIIVIDRVYKWENHHREEGFCDEIRINKNIDKVLLVSGELHSGNTARKYHEYFNNLGAKQIKMLTFMKEPHPTFQPDYYHIETSKSEIRFPWMLTKDYKRSSMIDYDKRSEKGIT